MTRRASAAAALLFVTALLGGCIAVVGEKKDPVHAQKLSELERRMDVVESRLPK
jgi:hypothetical protein